MQGTYNLNGIILSRTAFKERDSRIIFYSFEQGKISLVVRGTSSLKSKLSGHIEPISFCNIMAIEGKQFDYAGSVVCTDAYANIKDNYPKVELAGKAITFFLKEIKETEKDEEIFYFMKDFLNSLNLKKDDNINYDLFYYIFIFKLLDKLGYGPNLEISDSQKEFSFFDFKNSCLVLKNNNENQDYLKISHQAVNLLKILVNNNFDKIFLFDIDKNIGQEIKKIILLFYKYNFS